MAEDQGRRSSRGDQDSNRFSSLFERYSDSLSRSSDALNSAARTFNQSSITSDNAAKSFHRDVDRLMNAIRQFNRDFEDEVDRDHNSRRRENDEEEQYLRDHTRDMSSQYERVFGRSGNSYVNVAIRSLRSVFNFAISQFTNAANKVIDNYNSNFTAITSRQQISASKYTEALQNATNKITGDKFKTQFTQIDWAGQLIPVLETGIRGGLADQMAYQNMITTRLLPMINTNTKAYTRLSKTFGNQFSEAIQAIGTYTETVYGAEGLEEGQFENLLQSTYREIMTAVREQGGTGEDVSRIIQSFTGTYQEYAARYGSEVATNMLADFVDAATNTVAGDNLMALMAATESGIVGGNLKGLNQSTLAKFFASEAGNYRDLMSSSPYAIALASQAGIGNLQTAEDISNYDYFGQSVAGFDINRFNSEQQKEDQYRKLAEGYYVSITEQMDNWNINTIANTADKLAETIPHTTEVLGMIFDIVRSFFLAWLGRQGTDLLGRVGGGSGGGGGGLGSISSLLSAGKGASLFNGGATASTYLAGAAGVAGLIWGGIDAYHGVSASLARGDSTLGAIGQGARSFLTGGTAMSEEDQISALSSAMLGEKRSIDWGAALKNAGKGALLGAGASSVIPGLGTVVGTVVGGLVGGVASMIDQAIENAKYNKLAEASTKLTESLETLSATTANFNSTVDREKKLQEALNILNNEYYDSQGNLVQATEDQKQAALNYVKESDPMLQSVKDLKDWDEKYTEVVMRKVELEKDVAADAALSTMSSVSENIQEYRDAFDNIVSGDKYVNPAVLQFAQAVGSEDSEYSRNNAKFTELIREYVKKSGLTEDQFVDQARSLTSGSLILEGKDMFGNYSMAGGDADPWGTSGDNFKEALQDYDLSTGFRTSLSMSERNQLKSQIDAAMTNERSAIWQKYQSLYEVANGYVDDEGKLSAPASILNSMKSEYRSLINDMSSYNQRLRQYYGESEYSAYAFNTDDLNLPAELRVRGGKFKVGLAKVPYDDFSAVLHEGEMVLTSAQANQLRLLADEYGTNVSGLLSGHVKSSIKATNANFDASSISYPIVDAIKNHTVAVVSILTEIYDLVNLLIPEVKSISHAGSGYTRSVLSYEGI